MLAPATNRAHQAVPPAIFAVTSVAAIIILSLAAAEAFARARRIALTVHTLTSPYIPAQPYTPHSPAHAHRPQLSHAIHSSPVFAAQNHSHTMPPMNFTPTKPAAKVRMQTGVAAPTLPPHHANAALLSSLRARTSLTPRWPSTPAHQLRVSLLRSYGPAYSSIIVSHKLRVVYIPVFKAGTTSMMWLLAYLENNAPVLAHSSSPPHVLQHVLHDMSTPAWRGRSACHMRDDAIVATLSDPSYLKFTFVRNPYSRLVSAYVDKVATPILQSVEYQRQMYALYGTNVTLRTAANQTRPSFHEYVRAIANVLASPRTNAADGFENNLSRRDVHWRPQSDLAHPDLIHIDFVGSFDHLNKDREVLLEWMYRHTGRRMSSTMRLKLHSSDPAAKVRLMQLLKDDQKLRLDIQHMYREDFDRFRFPLDVPTVP